MTRDRTPPGTPMTPTPAADASAVEASRRDRARSLAELGDYVRTLAARMGLKDWTFEIELVPDEVKDAWPHCFVTDPDFVAKHVDLFVNSVFLSEPTEDRRLAIVRQLLHCHSERMEEFVISEFARTEGPEDEFMELLDEALTPIAAAWAPCLPLPLVGLMRRAGGGPESGDSR